MKTSAGTLSRTVSRIRSSSPFRQAGSRQLEAVEVAVVAPVLIVEQLLVHLLEIEDVIEGAAQPHVLEQIAAQVEGKALHPADAVDREFFLDDALFGDRRKIIGRRPLLGRILRDPVRLVGLEGFQRDKIVAEEFEAQFVEIIGPDPHRQRSRPSNP